MTGSREQSNIPDRHSASLGERLRVPWLLLLAGVVGVILYVSLGQQSWPAAAVDMKLSRKDAETRSAEFLASIGCDVSRYHRTTVFWSSTDELIYLDKTLGTGETNRLLVRTDLPVAGWETRFFVPLQSEEFSVFWSPRGELIGFTRHLPDDLPSPALTPADARRLAEQALARWFPGLSGRLAFSATAETKQSHRIDRTLEWRVDGAPAEMRRLITVGFSGSQLTQVMPTTFVPEAFTRHETAIASDRDLLQNVADMGMYLMMLGALIFAIFAWHRRWLRWKPAIAIASIIMLVEALNQLNQLPLAWLDYATQNSLSAFWLSQLQPLGELPFEAMALAIFVVVADSLGRLFPRSSYSLGDVTLTSLFPTRAFRTATLAGVGAAGIQLGYVSLFYVLGRKYFGVYSPIDVPEVNQLSTSFPWIQALLVGLSAAVTEESLFRLFAIPLLLRWVKRPWLAVLLPAILWGFLHTSYHVEPIFARGVELTIVGVFLGLVFLRFGIWATIVSHCMYNATVCSAPYLGSGSPYLIGASIAVIAAITLPALLGRSRKPFEFASLSWPAGPLPTAREAEQERRASPKVPALNLWPPAALCAVAIAIAALTPIRWWTPPRTIDAQEAVSAARQQLRQLGYTVDGYKHSASLAIATARPEVEDYLRDRMSRRAWLAYLDRRAPERTEWTVSFAAPGKIRAYGLRLDSRGHLVELACSEADSTALPSRPAVATRARAEQFLVANGIDLKRLDYAGLVEKSHPRRKDVQHVWIDTTASIGELRHKVKVYIRGDRIAGFSTVFQLPESYRRAVGQTTVWNQVQEGLNTLFGLLIVLLLALSLFGKDAVRPLFSKEALVVGVGWAVVKLLGAANGWSRIWAEYDSSEAVGVFLSRNAVHVAGDVLVALTAGYAITLMFLRFAPRAFADAPTATELRGFARTAPWRWHGTRAGFVWALAMLLMGVAIQCTFVWLAHGRSLDALQTEASSFGCAWPPFAIIDCTTSGLTRFLALGAIICALRRNAPKWLLWVTVCMYVASEVTIDPTAPWRAIDSGVTSGLLWVIVFYVVRFRLPFYFWYAMLSAAMTFVPWLIVPGPHQIQAMIALVAPTVLIAMTFRKFGRRSREVASTSDDLASAA